MIAAVATAATPAATRKAPPAIVVSTANGIADARSPRQALDERILAALDGQAASIAIRNLIVEAEDAVVIAERSHDHARERAIDPTTPATEVAEARRVMEDTAFHRDRMNEAARRLKAELKAAEAREAAEKHRAEVDVFLAERDRLVADLEAHYPAAATVIVGLLLQLERSEAERERLGLHADRSAEPVARGVPGHFYQDGSMVPRLREVRLPALRGHGFLWPR